MDSSGSGYVAKGNILWDVAGNASMTGALDANSGTLGSLTVDCTLTVGTGGTIQSANYVAASTGWKIDSDGSAEFRDVDIRGTIRSSVFVRNETQVLGGRFFVAQDAQTLYSSINNSGSLTYDINLVGNQLILDDIIRIKSTYYDTWAKVALISMESGYYAYTVDWMYGASIFSYEPGQSVVVYGANGDGSIMMTVEDTNAPYIEIFTHAGSPWITQTRRARLGNLTGITGASGYGLWTDNGFFTGCINAITGSLQDLSISGSLTIASAGGIYQGTGTFASPATGLKMWSDGGVGRIGGYSSSVLQWYGSTDGKLYVGSSAIRLDAEGITFTGGSAKNAELLFYDDYSSTCRQTAKITSDVYSGGSAYSATTQILAGGQTQPGQDNLQLLTYRSNGVIPVSWAEITLTSTCEPGTTESALYFSARSACTNVNRLYASGSAAGLVVPFMEATTNSRFNGDAVAVGTSLLNAASDFGVPASAIGILVRMTATWAASNTGTLAWLKPGGATQAPLLVRANGDNMPVDCYGTMGLNAEGDFEVGVYNANTTSMHIQVWGFIDA